MIAGLRARRAGFTLLEVMVGLALLGFALVVLIKSAAGNIFNAEQAQMMGVVTDLSRGKMYDVEEGLLKDGFQDTDQNSNGTFEDSGWPNVTWAAKVEVVEMPSWQDLQALASGKAKMLGSAAGSGMIGSNGLPIGAGSQLPIIGSAGDLGIDQLGSDALGQFQNSALGGMLSQFGGGLGGGIGGAGFGSDAQSGAGALVIQQQYTMVQQVLKVSIRKVTLTVDWKVGSEPNEFKVVAFFTDAAAMDKVLMGLGSQDIGDGSGSGTASTGSASSNPTSGKPFTPTTPTVGH